MNCKIIQLHVQTSHDINSVVIEFNLHSSIL